MDFSLPKKIIFQCSLNIKPERYQRVRSRIVKSSKAGGKLFKIHTYNPNSYSAYKSSLHYTLKKHQPPLSDGPIILSILFRKAPPASFSAKKRLELINNHTSIVTKIDIDNFLKAFNDAAQGACMLDDVQIIGLESIYKRYAEEDGIDLVIYSPIL